MQFQLSIVQRANPMGKGNWERRAELVHIRRDIARARKLSRGVLVITGESVIRKVLKFQETCEFKNVFAWIDGNSENNCRILCEDWFRSESCDVKRCSASHEVSIASLKNLHPYDTSFPKDVPQRYVVQVSLENISPSQYEKLNFLSIDGVCAYDWRFPEIWKEWLHQQSIGKDTPISSDMLPTISEFNELESNSDQIKIENHDDVFDLKSHNQVDSLFLVNDLPLFGHKILGHILKFCEMLDCCSLQLTCHHAKTKVRTDDTYCIHKREYLKLNAKDISRRKKEEKKKKVKNAFVKKTDKKDAFARGGRG